MQYLISVEGNFNYLPIILVIIVIASLCSTKILITLMNKLGIIDRPDIRRAHCDNIARGGGAGFVIIFILSFGLMEYKILHSLTISKYLIPAFSAISLVSFLDDISDVAIGIRLITHIICSYVAIKYLIHPHRILHYEIAIMFDLAIGTFALVTFLNIYNFLDGIDGITASQSIHLSTTILLLSILQYDIILNVDMLIIIATIILGWSIGFICFNWQPAQIFIGDVGSISIGFLLGICLLTIGASSIKLFVAAIIASLYYIADGGLTLLIRIIKGEKIWQPHLQHFFHQAVLKTKSHKKVVQRIIICNILLMFLAINVLYNPITSIVGAIIVVTTTLIRSAISNSL